MRLAGYHLPVEHFSATSLAKAINCPELYRRRYVLHEPEKISVDRFIGIVDHETHAENFRQKIDTGEDLDLDWMRGKYRARFQVQVEKEEPEWGDELPEEVAARGLLMVEAYHTIASPSVKPIAVEQRFEEHLPGIPRPLIGYMDIIEEPQIIERKTARQKVSKPKPDWRFQARLYQLVADLPTSFHVVTKQVTPAVYTPEVEPLLHLAKGQQDVVLNVIQQAVQRLEDLYLRLGADNPWPTEGLFHPWLCDYCSYKETGCPAWVVP